MNIEAIEKYVRFCSEHHEPEAPVAEKHHVIMRALMPRLIKDKNNLVKLTPRNHLLAHYWLTFAFPDDKGVLYAFNLMCNTRGVKNRGFSPEEVSVLAETYEAGKIKLRPHQAALRRAMSSTPEHRARFSAMLARTKEVRRLKLASLNRSPERRAQVAAYNLRPDVLAKCKVRFAKIAASWNASPEGKARWAALLGSPKHRAHMAAQSGRAHHIRWHLKRNITNRKCNFCQTATTQPMEKS